MTQKSLRSGVGSTDYASKSRNWCFTEFDIVENNELFDQEVIEKYNIIGYIYQAEQCPETGNYHYQGFLKLNSAYSLSHMKKILTNAHWEICIGSVKQNIDYCSKEDSRVAGPFQFGNLEDKQGQRTDLLQLRDSIISGDSIKTMLESNLGPSTIKFVRNIQVLRELYETPRTWPMEIFVFYSEKSGTGKSRCAWEIMGGTNNIDNIYVKDPEDPFWENYNGQDFVLFDDFDGSLFKRQFFLQILDRYPMRIKIKGKSGMFRSKYIVITTNYHPRTWFKKSEAVIRRLKEFGVCFNLDDGLKKLDLDNEEETS